MKLCERESLCVLMRKNISWNQMCVFFVHYICILVHISVLECQSVNALGSFHFVRVAVTAALGSCSNSWHVMWLHYARVYVCVSCLCLITAYMVLSQCKPGLCARHKSSVITSVFALALPAPPLPPVSHSLPLIGR